MCTGRYEGRCTACHKPHTSRHSGLLKGSGGELCFNCHPRAKYQAAFVHKPVEEGKCSSCHSPIRRSTPFAQGRRSIMLRLPPAGQGERQKERPSEIRQGNCTVPSRVRQRRVVGYKDRCSARRATTPRRAARPRPKPCAYEVAGSTAPDATARTPRTEAPF